MTRRFAGIAEWAGARIAVLLAVLALALSPVLSGEVMAAAQQQMAEAAPCHDAAMSGKSDSNRESALCVAACTVAHCVVLPDFGEAEVSLAPDRPLLAGLTVIQLVGHPFGLDPPPPRVS
ncbi:MAG: hypothetical protein KDE55_04620 [Novosphingobium sp.]|nr:hypothetical protein [Novosphingobium sp.]